MPRYPALFGTLVGLCLWVPGAAGAAELSLTIYGDVDYAIERTSTTQHSFFVPAFDIFATATADRWSFLGELLFEFPEGNSLATDLERAEIGYLVADGLRLRAGRFHSAIGYYNDAFHHGAIFETATGRPFLHNFEDEGGLLPAHLVGVHADGRFDFGKVGTLRYDVDLANGRGREVDEITTALDRNFGKALNLRLRYHPSFAPDLFLGGNVYLDQITATETRPELQEQIFAGHLVYLGSGLQLAGEVAQIRHLDRAGGAVFSTLAGYAEVAYSFEVLTPYVRYERLVAPSAADPFFTGEDGPMESFHEGRAGVKWLASEHVALKLEGQRRFQPKGDETRVTVQAAFAFGGE